MALEEWEKEHGPIPVKKREIVKAHFERLQNSLKMTEFSQGVLNPGQRLFEETASLSLEELRDLRRLQIEDSKLLTPQGQREFERITENEFRFYQAKGLDLRPSPRSLDLSRVA